MPVIDETMSRFPREDELRIYHDPIPFEEDTILFDDKDASMSQLVVLGVAGVLHRDGETFRTFTTWVQSIDDLTPEEIERAVFAHEFVGPDGHLNLPGSPDELIERLVA